MRCVPAGRGQVRAVRGRRGWRLAAEVAWVVILPGLLWLLYTMPRSHQTCRRCWTMFRMESTILRDGSYQLQYSSLLREPNCKLVSKIFSNRWFRLQRFLHFVQVETTYLHCLHVWVTPLREPFTSTSRHIAIATIHPTVAGVSHHGPGNYEKTLSDV